MPFQFLNHKLTLKSSLTKIYRNKNFNESDITIISNGERKQPTNITTCNYTPKIGFTTTPQYSYTNAECRLWIAAQLRVYYFILPRSAITAIADKFVSSGKKMFAMEREVWVEMLGNHGHVIRTLIRRVLWNEKRSLRAGLSKAIMNELRGECKVKEESEVDLEWTGLYPIR